MITFLLAVFFLATRGLNLGVDFKGGSLIEVQSKNGPADLHDIRTVDVFPLFDAVTLSFQVKAMKPGSVIIDVSIDQGGCV